MTIAITALAIHPVKSLRGIAVQEAVLEARGLRHDRRWLLVDENGRFLTQREHAKMALVDVAVDEAHARLLVRAPGMRELAVPFAPAGARRSVVIWKDTVEAVSVSEEAAAYFGEYMGFPCDLVTMPEETRRAVDPTYAREGDVVSFADAFPLLIASTASLDALGLGLPMRRFRPNVVISGAPAWDEDTWRLIRIAGVTMRLPKPCARCVITTIDPETAEKGREPLATLAKMREADGKVMFGVNVAHDAPGVLRVGDTVEVVTRS